MQNQPNLQADPNESPVLIQGSSATDFYMAMSAPSCWITVDNISVYITRHDDGIEVNLYPLGMEDTEPPLDYVTGDYDQASYLRGNHDSDT